MIKESSEKINEKTIPKPNIWVRYYWKYKKIKHRLKHNQVNYEKITINFFIGLAFFSILSGLIVFIVFLLKLSNYYSITGDKIILDKTGQVGDFIGGVVGAIWSLTGVLLFYATLRLQSKELSENRKHFQVSRLTDIIYKQLDLFNPILSNLKLRDIEKVNDEFNEQKGRAAVLLMRRRLEKIIEIGKDGDDEQKKQAASVRFLGQILAFVEINKNELQNIYDELENQVSVIRAILIKEDIPPSDLNELKSIFFKNIGLDFLNSSKLLKNLLESYSLHKKKQTKDIDDLYSPENRIISKIGVIEEFRNIQYNKKTINDYLRHRDMYNDVSY